MKNLIEFKLENGESAFMQIEETEKQVEVRKRVSRERGMDEDQPTQTERTFSQAISCVAPIGNSLLNSLKDINEPDEIKLEFGLAFNAKAGVIFTSVESAASFKVCITWKNTPES